MVARRRTRKTLLLGALGLLLLHCEPSEDGDTAGEAGSGGSGNASGSGNTAGKGGASTSGGSGGSTGGASAGVGASGGTGGGGAGAGTGGTGGSTPTAGKGGSSGTGGTSTASCDNPTPVTTRGPAPEPVEEATFAAQWPALVCAAMEPGCGSSGTAYDETSCLAYAATALDTTLAYDALEAGSCLEQLRQATWASTGDLGFRGLPASCYYVYRGDVPPGEACEDDADCAPHPRGPVWCDFDTAVCTVLVRGKLGDECHVGCELETDNGSCYPLNDPEEGIEVTCHNEDGLSCDEVSGTCVPSIPVGCPCILGISDYCNADSSCTEGIDAVCVARGALGAPCILHSDCVRSAYCPEVGASPVCTERKHEGEACEDHDECVGSSCQGGACIADAGFFRGSFDDAYCDGMGS